MSNKDCKDIKELLSSYIDGDLSDNEMILVDSHIKTCASCKKELFKLAKMVEILKKLPKYNAPTNVLPMVHKKIDERKNIFQRIFTRGMRTVLSGALLILLVVYVVQMQKSGLINVEKLTKVTTETKKPKNKIEAKNAVKTAEKIRKAEPAAERRITNNKESAARDIEARTEQAGKIMPSTPSGAGSYDALAKKEEAVAPHAEKDTAPRKKTVMALKAKGLNAPADDEKIMKEQSAEKTADLKKDLDKADEAKRATGSASAMSAPAAAGKQELRKESGIPVENNVIRTRKNFLETLIKVSSAGIPNVDFDTQMVIFVSVDQGKGFEIRAIKAEKDRILVELDKNKVKTFDYKIINRSDLPVEFVIQ